MRAFTITAFAALALLIANAVFGADAPDAPFDPRTPGLTVATATFAAHGELQDVQVVGAFDSIDACMKAMIAKVKQVGPPPAGGEVDIACTDFIHTKTLIIHVHGDPKAAAPARPVRPAPGQQTTDL